MAFYPDHFRLLIRQSIRPLGLWSPEAEELLMGTCAVESGFGTYLRQLGNGPALGPLQVEPETERDIWTNHLRFRDRRRGKVIQVSGVSSPNKWQLECNLAYNVIMARLKYRMMPGRLPPAHDIEAQAVYWDVNYNANPSHGWPEDYVIKYRRYVKPA